MSQVKNEVAFAESEAIRTEDPCYVLGTILRILLLPVGLAAGAAVVGFSAHPFTVFRTNPTPDPGRNPWPKYFKMRATYSMIASGALALFLNSVALVALVRLCRHYRHRRHPLRLLAFFGAPLVGCIVAGYAVGTELSSQHGLEYPEYTMRTWSCSRVRDYVREGDPDWRRVCRESSIAFGMAWLLLVAESVLWLVAVCETLD